MAGVPIESPADFSGAFRTLWDQDAFYLLIEITDDSLVNLGISTHHNDNTEVYFDLNNSKFSTYDNLDDDQIRFEFGRTDSFETKRGATGLEFKQVKTNAGWCLEARFPWTALTAEAFVPEVDRDIGFDLMITDNDGEDDKKDHILAWHSPNNDAWKDPTVFGVMRLLASGTTDSVYYDSTPPDHDDQPIDESKISHIIYVNQRHPQAADTNSGTHPEQPLKTLTRALELAGKQIGAAVATKILVYPGVYREGGLTMLRQGSPNSFLNTELVIEGTLADSVIISGSDVWNDGWTLGGNDSWRHDWPYAMQPQNAWGDRVTGLGARREMLFVNGKWMRQVLERNEMTANSFYVADNEGIYVKVAADIDFAAATKEVSLRGDGLDAPWPPAGLLVIPAEKDKVVLRNLVFQHANMRLQNAGTVQIKGWKVLLDHCKIVWNNGFGLQLGAVEQVAIQNCQIDHNGGAGIMTWGANNSTIENSSTSFNNWRGDMGGLHSYALGGIKFHHSHNFTIRNHQAEYNLCPGLWTDLNVTGFTYDGCTVTNNWGPGFLVEITADATIENCTLQHNAEGIRIHSSHEITVDGCTIQGNAIQFSLYNDHRDFASQEWQDQLGQIWDKTPSRWTLQNCEITAEDNPAWQDSVENRIPAWIKYHNPGYQPFFHFSAPKGYLDFYATATIQHNTWTHPATDTPFQDVDGNPLTLAQWRQYIKTLGTTGVNQSEAPVIFYTVTNYPNPFNPQTTLHFSIEKTEPVKIMIYNSLDKKVKTITDQIYEHGQHQLVWDGTNDQGQTVSSGIYFYKMETPHFRQVKKCLLVR